MESIIEKTLTLKMREEEVRELHKFLFEEVITKSDVHSPYTPPVKQFLDTIATFSDPV